MEIRYHINPDTGRPNRCYATKKPCKYASRHFETKDEARKHYEEMRSDSTQKTLKKSLTKKSDESKHEENDDSSTPAIVHTYSSACRNEVENSLEKANRRLERFGIDERFDYDIEEYVHTTQDKFGNDVHEERIRLNLRTPSISYGDHRFLAAVENDGEVLTMKTAHDVELRGWRPSETKCDHCGHNRPRRKTYIVEDTHGRTKQIGSSCVQGYLGVKPEGLWAIGHDPLEGMDERFEGAPKSYVESTNLMLASAMVLSNDGKKFVSKSQAQWSEDSMSTADQVSDLWNDSLRISEEDRRQRDQIRNEVIAASESPKIAKLRKDLSSLDESNDWQANVKRISEKDFVSRGNTSLLLSGIIAVRKREEREKQAQKPKSVGHWGTPKEKIAGRKVNVEQIRYFDGYNQFNGMEETRAQVKFRDDEGKIGIWWTTSKVDDELEGKDVEFTSGSIKKHDQYNGDDQTVLTRVKLKSLDDNSDKKD